MATNGLVVCSNPFVPSFTSIFPFIPVTFPLLKLRHGISLSAEANTDTAAPTRPLTLCAGRHVAEGSRGRVWTCCTSFSTSPCPARPSSSSSPSELVRSLAHRGPHRWWRRRYLLRRHIEGRRLWRLCCDIDAATPAAAKTPTVAVAAVAMTAVTTQTVTATGVDVAGGGGDADCRRRRRRRHRRRRRPVAGGG